VKRIVLDTDTGADDALAVIFAVKSPEIRLEAVTTVSGNVHVDLCTRNVLLILEQLGVPDPPPVCRGADKPLANPLFNAADVHGYDGIGQITHLRLADGARKYPEPSLSASSTSAPDKLLELADRYGRELNVVAVGPLTNLALAARKGGNIMRKLGGIIIMGGAFQVPGNTTPVAEFNIFVDPEAASEVLDLDIPTTIVPLNVTEQTILFRSDLEAAAQKHPDKKALDMVIDITDHYMKFHAESRAIDGCFMHDPLAVGVAINPEIVSTVKTEVRVETKGEWTKGMTVGDFRPWGRSQQSNASVALEVNARAFIHMFLERLSA
jgi:inosine-uridine nucleoside N-ribohydrolase